MPHRLILHVNETIGLFCSIFGTLVGLIYLRFESSTINLSFPTFYIEFGVVMCVVGCGVIAIFAAMEKVLRFFDKRREKKLDKKI